MCAFSEFIYKNMEIGNKRMNFRSIFYTIYAQETSKHLMWVCLCECRFVLGCITQWLKRERWKGLESRVKVWSKDESHDYIGIGFFYIYYTSMYTFILIRNTIVVSFACKKL